MQSEVDSVDSDLSVVQFAVDEAGEWGLQAEVVYFALRAMRDNPTLSIGEAITIGLNEWVK